MYILTTDKFLAGNPPAAKLLTAIKIDINDISAEHKLMADRKSSLEARFRAWMAEASTLEPQKLALFDQTNLSCVLCCSRPG